MSNEPNAERIALWVAALRDPDAKQTTKVLTRADGSGDCCLGIASKVAIANGLELETCISNILIGSETVECVSYGRYEAKTFMPIAVKHWYGLLAHNPVVGTVDGFERSATQANDSLGLSFTEIADLLEKHYLTPAEAPVEANLEVR